MKDRAFWEIVYRSLMAIAKAIKARHLTPTSGANGAKPGVIVDAASSTWSGPIEHTE